MAKPVEPRIGPLDRHKTIRNYGSKCYTEVTPIKSPAFLRFYILLIDFNVLGPCARREGPSAYERTNERTDERTKKKKQGKKNGRKSGESSVDGKDTCARARVHRRRRNEQTDTGIYVRTRNCTRCNTWGLPDAEESPVPCACNGRGARRCRGARRLRLISRSAARGIEFQSS